jgi:hypothetical protein
MGVGNGHNRFIAGLAYRGTTQPLAHLANAQ